jgi:hypothetical protein
MGKKRRKLSNILVIWEIMRDATLTKNAKIVGVSIAMRRNLKTLVCCPSQSTICTDSAIRDPKQVSEAIETLEAKKYIRVAKDRTTGSKWDHCQYYFLRDWAAQRALVKSPEITGDKHLFGFSDVGQNQ